MEDKTEMVAEKRSDNRRVESLLAANNGLIEAKREVERELDESKALVEALTREVTRLRAELDGKPQTGKSVAEEDMEKLARFLVPIAQDLSDRECSFLNNLGPVQFAIRLVTRQRREKDKLEAEIVDLDGKLQGVIRGRNLLADDVVIERERVKTMNAHIQALVECLTLQRNAWARGGYRNLTRERDERDKMRDSLVQQLATAAEDQERENQRRDSRVGRHE